MGNSPDRGFTRITKAFRYSMAGLSAAWHHEEAFRQELLLTLILIPTGLWFGANKVEKTLLIGSCLLLLIVELLNSAVEAVVDRIGPEHHSLAGQAKDMGSAAVFIALLLTATTWWLILGGTS